MRVEPATGEVCPTIAEDLLRGADEIARFLFGSTKHRRKVYYYATDAKVRMPASGPSYTRGRARFSRGSTDRSVHEHVPSETIDR